MDISDLPERLEEHSKYLDSMLSLIPPKYYFNEENEVSLNKYAKNLNGKQKKK